MALLNTTPGALNQGSPASQPGQKLNASPNYTQGTPNQLRQALSGGVPNLGSQQGGGQRNPNTGNNQPMGASGYAPVGGGPRNPLGAPIQGGGTGKAPGTTNTPQYTKQAPITKQPPIAGPVMSPPYVPTPGPRPPGGGQPPGTTNTPQYPGQTPGTIPGPDGKPIYYPGPPKPPIVPPNPTPGPIPSPGTGAGPASKFGTNLNKSKTGAEKRHGYDEMAALAAKHGWAKQNNLPYDYTRDYPSNMPGLANQPDPGTGNQNKNSGKGDIWEGIGTDRHKYKAPSSGYGNPSSKSSGSKGTSSKSSGSKGASSMGQPTHPIYGGDYLKDAPMQHSSDPGNWKSGAGTPGVGLPQVILPSDTQRSINQYASDQFGSADANYLANQMAGQGASTDAGTMAMIAPKMGAAASDVSSFQKQKPLHDFYTNQMYQLGEDRLMGKYGSGTRGLQNQQIANQIRQQEGYYPLIQSMMY